MKANSSETSKYGKIMTTEQTSSAEEDHEMLLKAPEIHFANLGVSSHC